MSATAQQVSLLHHTLGLRPDRRESTRNHFVAGQGHHDRPDLEALEASGLMARGRTPKFCDPEDIVFYVTDAGREVAMRELPEPPKRTRYGEYLHADSCDSFGEFLCGYRLPTFQSRHLGSCKWEYRMSRGDCYSDWRVDGEWCATKKDAKASYKAALAKFKALRSGA